MHEYASWHEQHRNDPDARFLMYSCHDQMNGQKITRCGGHGNRIKHICWTLRAAAASRRVLLVDWLSPEHLEEYLLPVAVDWRPNDAERAILADTADASSRVPVHHFGWPDVGTAPPPVDVKYVRVTGGPPGKHADSKCYNCTGFHASFNSLYRFLFRPTAAFREHVHATRVQLFGGGAVPYVSMHVRMGDSAEGSLLFNTSRFLSRIRDSRFTLSKAALAIACVSSAAPALPLFIATDNAALKVALAAREPASINATNLVASTAFRRIVVSGCTGCMVNAVHQRDGALDADGLRATFVDIALLAGGVDFVHMGQSSNYATWAEGWRGLGENGSFDFPTQFNERSGKAACAHWLADKGHGNARALDRGEARHSTDGVL